MTRVLLVVPPFHSLRTPSLATGQLKAELCRRGVPCDARYVNLQFGALAGRDVYDTIAGNARGLIGDWLFADTLFDERPAGRDAYVRAVAAGRFALGPELVAQIEALRAETPAFLDGIVTSDEASRYGIVVACADLAVGEDRIQNGPVLALLRRWKELHPDVVTVMGGANCQAELGAAIHDLFPFVDYVCAGEVDRAVPQLIERLLAGETTVSLPGVIGPGSVPVLGASIGPPLVRDLDRLPYPDFDDYFEQYAASGLAASERPLLAFEASRGCWWGEKHHCTFCGLNGAAMQYRSKSPRRALDELDYLVERHGVRSAFASDMILDPRYVETFLAELANRPLPPTLFFETKANLTKGQLRVLARAGVRELQPGIESFSTPILKLMDKGVTALQNVRLLKWCAELGIRPFWNILYGFPGEEPAEYERMAQLIPSLTHLAPPYGTLKLRMDRFSPNFDQAAARGFVEVRPAEAYRHVYPLAPEAMSRLAYYFDYAYADGRDPTVYAAPVHAAVEQWLAASGAARLELHGEDDCLEIRDSRPVASSETTVLRGAARLAYLALDDGRTLRDVMTVLRRELGDDTPAAEHVEIWLTAWEAARLVMREGARYLSLATNPAERVPLPIERLLALMRPPAHRQAERSQPEPVAT